MACRPVPLQQQQQQHRRRCCGATPPQPGLLLLLALLLVVCCAADRAAAATAAGSRDTRMCTAPDATAAPGGSAAAGTKAAASCSSAAAATCNATKPAAAADSAADSSTAGGEKQAADGDDDEEGVVPPSLGAEAAAAADGKPDASKQQQQQTAADTTTAAKEAATQAAEKQREVDDEDEDEDVEDYELYDDHDGSGSVAAAAGPEAVERHLAALLAVAAHRMPAKSAADRGSYVDFLVLISEVAKIPTFSDKHFNPIVVPVAPPELLQYQQTQTPAAAAAAAAAASDSSDAAAADAADATANSTQQQQQQAKQQQQPGEAGDMLRLLAKHRVQFILSVGNRSHFDVLEALPAQFRHTWFHAHQPHHVTPMTVETYYWHAIQLPIGGPPAEPLISLFTPAYKSGPRIHTPYASLLAQTYSNWEWVVWDDSPPGDNATWAELSALRDADPRIQIFRTDRNDGFIGSVKARACFQASGQLLVELDHDDALLPAALEQLKEALVANPDAGLFYGEAVELYQGTWDAKEYGNGWAFGHGLHFRQLLSGHWVSGAVAPHFNTRTLRYIVGVPNHVRAWRREAYLALGGHTRGLPVVDDYDLILRSVFKYPAVYVRHLGYIQYRQPKQTFTYKRNSLIQRLTKMVAAEQDAAIAALLAQHNMTDTGPGTHHKLQPAQLDATPTGPPLARFYHQATAKAPRLQPHVTVIIPTFNNSAGLLAALESVYAQDYPNWELLIIGDRCPTLDKFMEQHKPMFLASPRAVRYYNLPTHAGGGGFAPLNAGSKVLAASDWHAYLRDDTTWTAEHLSSLVSVWAEDPARSYVFASMRINDKVLLADQPRLFRMDTSAVLLHRRLIENHGGWRSQSEVGLANDWELFSRWQDEPWGASLRPTVVLPPRPDEHVELLLAS